jgi:hypothetical protein
MPQPGTTQVPAPIDTTAIGDTYPSHKADRGKGGYRSVATTIARDAITVERREEGMWVKVLSGQGIIYELNPDLTTWTAVVVGSQVNYVNTWNAATNTPTLADNTGTNGNGYIVGVAGTQNLGSGNQTFASGDEVIHLAGIWQKISGSVTGVVSVNGFTNVVNLSTGDIPESTDLNYVSDDILAGLENTPNPASSSNPFATQADLTSLIVVGNGVFMPELFSDGKTLGNGTLRTLASLGYTNTTAGNYWTRVNSAYTIDVNTMSIDWIAWQEAYLAMQQDGYSKIVSPGGRGYCPSQQLDLPLDQLGVTLTRRGLEFIFDGQGSTFYNLTGNDFIIMSRYFTNETQISGANSYLVDYDYHFLNWKSEGNGGNSLTDGFIRLGATTHSTFHNIKTSSFGCPINLEFALELTMDNIKHEGYGLYGTKITPGTWTGGSAATSGVNLVRVTQHRCVNSSGKTPTAGIYSGGGGNLTFDTLAFEGYNGSVHHFLSETPGQVAAESALTLTNLYFETAGASRAAIKCVADKGDFFVNKWNNVVAKADLPVFFEFAHKSAPPIGVRKPFIKIENCATNGGGAGGLPKFRAVTQQALGYGAKWCVQYVNMPSVPVLNVASNWDTSVANSYIPDDTQVIDYIPSPV